MWINFTKADMLLKGKLFLYKYRCCYIQLYELLNCMWTNIRDTAQLHEVLLNQIFYIKSKSSYTLYQNIWKVGQNKIYLKYVNDFILPWLTGHVPTLQLKIDYRYSSHMNSSDTVKIN